MLDDHRSDIRPEEVNQAVRLSTLEVALFTRQLSVLLGAGVPVREALECLVRGVDREETAVVLTGLLKAIENGHPFSESMTQFPRVFNYVYLAMVKVGEETGRLVATLDRLSNWLERESNLMRSTRSTLTYPVLVLVVATLLGVAFFVFIFPGFAQTLQSAGPLPLLTQFLMLLSLALRSPFFWFLFLVGVVVALVTIRGLLLSSTNRVAVWKALARVPVLGPLLRDLCASRFFAALALMLDSGVELRRTFRLGVEASGNPVLKARMEVGLSALSVGTELSAILRQSPVCFDPIAVSLVAVAEEAADMPRVMRMLGESLNADTEHRLEVLGALMEPILMSVVAVIVAMTVLGIALPIYGMVATQI